MRYFTIIIFCLFTASLLSQTRVSGIVLDEFGEPLPFATIAASGTTTGATADEDGYYTLDVPSDVDELVFSYVGYSVTTRPLLEIEEGWLAVELSGGTTLQEIVVIGYPAICCQIVSCCSCVTLIADCFGSPKKEISQQPQIDPFATSISTINVFPNPFISELHLELTAQQVNTLAAQLYDINARLVTNWPSLPVAKGTSVTTLRIMDKRLVPGHYLLRLVDKAGNSRSIKVINATSVSQ
ncbi:MAG: carboxypeptidase-like regulatory domain-containing protein [Bacteroidota bacterium]